jgi:hypothetical protein
MVNGAGRELGDITPLHFVDGILQIPGGTQLFGLDEIGRNI